MYSADVLSCCDFDQAINACTMVLVWLSTSLDNAPSDGAEKKLQKLVAHCISQLARLKSPVNNIAHFSLITAI
jgi:hypothetical protein